jgi:hypothetical protein|tara:strand:+ start:277 stop:657 length:381 start_codon:yes stop_codon:yes gene_type:complete
VSSVLFSKKEENKMINKKYKFPAFDNEYYNEKYAGIKNSLNYDESEDIQTLKKENNNEDVLVWDTFQTDDEISALCSAINIIGETIDNTLEGEWADEEQEEQYKQTMKHLCRLSNRYPDRMGRKLI